mgnify:CR=1 FL=1
MKDFLLTQVMTSEQLEYAVDKSHAVIGHTTRDGEHVTVARQWRLKTDGVFTNHVTVAIGGRGPKKSPLQLVHPQSDGKLTDGMISTNHFAIWWLPIEDEVTIKDLYSTNGTFVNGQKIKPNSSHLLKDGDEILVGETRLLFEKIESRLLFEKIEMQDLTTLNKNRSS